MLGSAHDLMCTVYGLRLALGSCGDISVRPDEWGHQGETHQRGQQQNRRRCGLASADAARAASHVCKTVNRTATGGVEKSRLRYNTQVRCFRRTAHHMNGAASDSALCADVTQGLHGVPPQSKGFVRVVCTNQCNVLESPNALLRGRRGADARQSRGVSHITLHAARPRLPAAHRRGLGVVRLVLLVHHICNVEPVQQWEGREAGGAIVGLEHLKDRVRLRRSGLRRGGLLCRSRPRSRNFGAGVASG